MKSVLNHALDQPLNDGRRDLRFGQPDDIPSGQKRFNVFARVRDEAGGAIVATTAFDEQASFDFEERLAFDVREIGPPAALRMKSVFAFKRRPAERLPEQQELPFKMGRSGFVAEART